MLLNTLTVFAALYAIIWMVVIVAVFYQFCRLSPREQSRATINISWQSATLFLASVAVLVVRIFD